MIFFENLTWVALGAGLIYSEVSFRLELELSPILVLFFENTVKRLFGTNVFMLESLMMNERVLNFVIVRLFAVNKTM